MRSEKQKVIVQAFDSSGQMFVRSLLLFVCVWRSGVWDKERESAGWTKGEPERERRKRK